MREIKFRAWTGMEMEYQVIVGKLGAFYATGLDPEDSACISPFNTRYSEGTPIMQYAGLNDKNGREIYEGDIIDNGNGPVEVFWNEAYLALWVKYENKDIRNSYYAPMHDTDFFTEDSEVIGNIHENPELLETK